jgi:hypothetical protein
MPGLPGRNCDRCKLEIDRAEMEPSRVGLVHFADPDLGAALQSDPDPNLSGPVECSASHATDLGMGCRSTRSPILGRTLHRLRERTQALPDLHSDHFRHPAPLAGRNRRDFRLDRAQPRNFRDYRSRGILDASDKSPLLLPAFRHVSSRKDLAARDGELSGGGEGSEGTHQAKNAGPQLRE